MMTPEESIGIQPRPASWRGIDVLLIALAVIGLTIAGSAILLVGFAEDVGRVDVEIAPSLAFSLAAMVLNVLAFGVPVIAAGLWRRIDWRAFGWRGMSWSWWQRAMLAGIAAIFVTNLVAWVVVVALDQPLDNPMLDFVMPEGFSWGGLVGMTLLAGLLVPAAEEMLFRGVLFRWLRVHTGFGWAAAISSGVFGLFHGLPPFIVGAAVLGLISAWVYERSGSIWSAILVHAINNAVKIIIAYLVVIP